MNIKISARDSDHRNWFPGKCLQQLAVSRDFQMQQLMDNDFIAEVMGLRKQPCIKRYPAQS